MSNKAVSFSLEYLNILKNRLHIDYEDSGEPFFIPSRFKQRDLDLLNEDLTGLWESKDGAMTTIRNSEGAHLQSNFYGLANDFSLLLRTGFLISDRIILWDILKRTLSRKKSVQQLNLDIVGAIANNIVKSEELIKRGNVVILPHPMDWDNRLSHVIEEISEKNIKFDDKTLGLISSIIAVKEINISPYTLVEDAEYKKLLEEQKVHFQQLDQVESQDIYLKFITALLSERLLTDEKFKWLNEVPIMDFHNIISQKNDFYFKLKQSISSADSKEAELKYHNFNSELDKEINSWTSRARDMAGNFSTAGNVVSGILGVLSVSNPSFGLAAGVTALSSTLLSTISQKGGENTVTGVFRDLKSGR